MEVNILLVIVGGIIAIGAIVGFAKGAVRIAVSLGATILTLAVVYFATPYVSKAIYSLTPIDEMVEQQCIKTMTKAFGRSGYKFGIYGRAGAGNPLSGRCI